jgi:ABC-type siderophore export system fused ATPase/permease subunit
METKNKIQVLEKEIKSIDRILYSFLAIILIQSILVLLSITALNAISLGVIVGTIILFRKNVQNRNVKETMMRIYEAMDDIDAFEEKYENK